MVVNSMHYLLMCVGWPMPAPHFSMHASRHNGYISTSSQPYLEPGDGPIVLVLAPTRELAMQIKEECDKFGCTSGIKNTVVYGGVPKRGQVYDLRYDAIRFTHTISPPNRSMQSSLR